VGVNIGRGGYEEAYSAAGVVLDTRERLCRLFGASHPENVVFTSGITASMNMLLKGFLQPGDHVLTSSVEHNAVMRPLRQLEQKGVQVELIPCNPDGTLQLDKLEGMFRENTKLLVMTHASNVCGTLLPVREAAALCKQHGVRIVVDTAQSGGLIEVDMEGWGLDAVGFAGHKSLLGPQGIGGFIIAPDMVPLVDPLLSGGTGSISHLETVPDFMPDRFECGTQNLPGIFGLNAALRWIEQTGMDKIREHELGCTGALIRGFLELDGVRIAGIPGTEGRAAAVSVDFVGRDNAEIAFRLEDEYGIMTRCGLHCAPSAHKTLGTYPQGTVRFTPGYSTTEADVAAALEAVRAILAE
jgi:cysteine desulfurase family protein